MYLAKILHQFRSFDHGIFCPNFMYVPIIRMLQKSEIIQLVKEKEVTKALFLELEMTRNDLRN